MAKRNVLIETSILDYLKSNDCLPIKDAASMFNVSESTIRRIFIRLEEEKKAVRTFGGLIAAPQDNFYSYDLTIQRAKKEKEQIGRYAVNLLTSSDFIYLDCGTTTAFLAHEIVKAIQDGRLSEKLNIVTNSLVNLEILNPYCNVTLSGGTLSEKRKSFTGTLCCSLLSRFQFSKGFFGADGMSYENGFSSDSISVSQLVQSTIAHTTESYVLIDSAKINKPSYVTYASLNEVTGMITDHMISKTDQEMLSHYSLKLLIASSE